MTVTGMTTMWITLMMATDSHPERRPGRQRKKGRNPLWRLVCTHQNRVISGPLMPRKEPVKSLEFLFLWPLHPCVIVPQKNRNVTLLSTMHHDSSVDATTSKPDMILDYNKTKGGVDTIDQMCTLYNVARITRRWPLVVFFNLLNLAAINASALYRLRYPNWRRDFIRQLAHELVLPQLH